MTLKKNKVQNYLCKLKSPADQSAGRKEIYEENIKNQVDNHYRKYNLIGGMTENI